jgi:hypothetical protein
MMRVELAAPLARAEVGAPARPGAEALVGGVVVVGVAVRMTLCPLSK